MPAAKEPNMLDMVPMKEDMLKRVVRSVSVVFSDNMACSEGLVMYIDPKPLTAAVQRSTPTLRVKA